MHKSKHLWHLDLPRQRLVGGHEGRDAVCVGEDRMEAHGRVSTANDINFKKNISTLSIERNQIEGKMHMPTTTIVHCVRPKILPNVLVLLSFIWIISVKNHII